MFDILAIERLIFKLENGVKAIRLGDLSIAESMPPSTKISQKSACICLGLFASMAWVLLRHALAQRQKS